MLLWAARAVWATLLWLYLPCPFSSAPLWLPKVQLRHTRAALLLGTNGNAYHFLGFGGRHTEGDMLSPRTANFNTGWTLNKPPLKGCSKARHCSPLLTFYELGRMCVTMCPLWTDLLPGRKKEMVRKRQWWGKWVGALQLSLHLFEKWVLPDCNASHPRLTVWDTSSMISRWVWERPHPALTKYTAVFLHCSDSDPCQWIYCS